MNSTQVSSKRRPHAHERPLPRAQPGRKTERRFDVESGQVFSETEVRFSRKQHSDWICEMKTPALVKKPRPNENGARSLADMAKIKVATHFGGLTADHFATVPWTMARKVWEELLLMYEAVRDLVMTTLTG